MALSKPRDFLFSLVSAYLSKLYTSPLRTKAFTSCAIAALGNIISQKIAGIKYMNTDSLVAFALFGVIFGGPIPHYFNRNLYHLTKDPSALFLIERLIFTPFFQALYLYMLPLFEGKNHNESVKEMKQLYPSVISANLKYISMLQFINLKYVPPMLRILITNLIDLIWTVYVAGRRMKLVNQARTGKKTAK